ncbi:hypothetical protein VTN31DRAFT_7053 [Thermomyces dupontii]|uniref:uncharacterized protein n=1 Tax=Talaromyces thermophilus TaxID=28565 RepID=UPI0037426E24
MHYAVKLFDLSPNLSLDCLKQLFSKMSMDSSKKDFLEQTFVTVARLLSSPSLHSPDFLDFLCGIANRMVEESRLMLSTVVSEAVLIILWRKIELLFSQGNFSSAQRWCCFTQHPVFQHSGCVNRLKVLRKSALCAIHTGDVQPVWNMWEKARNDVELDGETIYVMYRLTLASSKAVPGIGLGFAKECLRLLLGGESSRWNYFLACISAAQTAGRDGVLLDHLYQLSIDETALKSTRQLEYFRITISITTKEARKGLREGKDGCELMDMLCDLFDRASRISSNDINELEWFSRNSYRFALEICESRLVNYAMRLFRMSARVSISI